MKYIAKAVRSQIQSEKVEFSCKVSTNMGNSTDQIMMVGDKGRLCQILLNLLMNAVKFTAEGKIELSIEVINKRHSHMKDVRFRVTDTGIGIEKSRLPKVFNLFEKAENATIEQYLSSKSKCKISIIITSDFSG